MQETSIRLDLYIVTVHVKNTASPVNCHKTKSPNQKMKTAYSVGIAVLISVITACGDTKEFAKSVSKPGGALTIATQPLPDKRQTSESESVAQVSDDKEGAERTVDTPHSDASRLLKTAEDGKRQRAPRSLPREWRSLPKREPSVTQKEPSSTDVAMPSVREIHSVSPLTKVDAAIFWEFNARPYLFAGGGYSRYTGAVRDSGHPRALPGGWRQWPEGWSSGIDAALFWHPNGRAYFFKGDRYLRYTATKGVDPGYPKALSEWAGWPKGWKDGIDAAVFWPNKGKTYFFKGDRYLRYTATKGVDAGYPRPLPGEWKAWPDSWNSGIDAAMVIDGTGYFFKGDRYLRYTADKGVDPGYPKTLEDWPEKP